MAAAAFLMELDDKETILDIVYSNFNTEDFNGLIAEQLQTSHGELRGTKLSLRQIYASMNYVCATPLICDREEVHDVLKEMDRR